MDKNILILSWEQYGYHTDNYMYCKYLTKKNKVTIISYDYNLEKIPPFDNLEVIYIKRWLGEKISRMKFLLKTILLIAKNNYDVIFVRYFRGCSILKKIFKNKKFIVDIRTGSIDKNEKLRIAYNEKISQECEKFEKITVISEGLSNLLNLNKNKVKILPLGAETVVEKKIKNNSMNFLYVGTFYNRNIKLTIEAFYKFYKKYGDKIDMKYTIAGFSENENDIKEIKKIIKDLNVESKVNYIGRVKHSKLYELFEEHNIGVSYIPVKDYFNYQPPTKTYEYILNGLICLATETLENKKVINNENGITFKDDVDQMVKGMEKIYHKLDSYNVNQIMKSLNEFQWENIVNKMNIDIL